MKNAVLNNNNQNNKKKEKKRNIIIIIIKFIKIKNHFFQMNKKAIIKAKNQVRNNRLIFQSKIMKIRKKNKIIQALKNLRNQKKI